MCYVTQDIFSANALVSDRSRPPVTFDLFLSESAVHHRRGAAADGFLVADRHFIQRQFRPDGLGNFHLVPQLPQATAGQFQIPRFQRTPDLLSAQLEKRVVCLTLVPVY